MIYGEETYQIGIGNGIYTSELASNIPDGFCAKAYNMIASGDSLENRQGFTQTSVDYSRDSSTFFEGGLRFNQLGNNDFNFPNLAFCEGQLIHFVRGGRPGEGSGDGFMTVDVGSTAGNVANVCQYGSTFYFSSVDGVHKILTFNWSTDAITFAQVVSSDNQLLWGLFAFKDRLWGWNGDKLFYTDVAPVGGLPETWAPATKFVPFRGPGGLATIVNVVPVSNKLVVFTTAGLYTLTVQGEPSSWINRLLDAKSKSTQGGNVACGFEANGIVYYANSRGVFATNTIDTIKLSSTIEDNFYNAGELYITLNFLDDGMLLSMTKKTGLGQVDSSTCKLFYSKLDPIAWTSWGSKTVVGFPEAFLGHNITNIVSCSDRITSYLSNDPSIFVMLVMSESVEGANANYLYNFCVYDGGENKLKIKEGTIQTITDKVKLELKTRFADGGAPFRKKRNKEAYVEAYTSDTRMKFKTQWSIDASPNPDVRLTEIDTFAVGEGSNLCRIPSDFMYRRCALSMTVELQTNDSQFKLKNVIVVGDTKAKESELVG